VTSPETPKPLLDVRRLGRTKYEDAHALQQELVAERVEGKIRDTLVLTEHEPVITLGRGAKMEDVAGVSLPVFEVERGGEATWHGPGQVVAYPILLLPESRRDLHRYMRDLEEVVLRVLAEFQVEGRRESGKTGVWIGSKKVCSIGVAVRRWVTFHGLALNVHNDPAAFLGFNPCGLDPQVMTRLADHAELPPATILIEVLLIRHFTEVFGFELPPRAIPTSPEGSDPRFPELPILG
jgi:lipoate-protein ligase B